MLYEMAKRHDEWPGEEYDGSSLRGAINGWKNMGVCLEDKWPYTLRDKGKLTIERAEEARRHTIGAYYRLKPEITDFHAALNEAGVIAVSARVHQGWNDPGNGRIRQYKRAEGGHAFAIVGYTSEGFLVQNSWGKSWGGYHIDGKAYAGVALWTYEDWISNIMDAWVFRLSLPTPQIFGMRPTASRSAQEAAGRAEKSPVPRADIAGHFVHVDDGAYKTTGQYWSTPDDVEQTVRLVAGSTKYRHLLVYAHGGLNSPEDSVRRIAALKDGFKRNGVYPLHIMYDTGIVED